MNDQTQVISRPIAGHGVTVAVTGAITIGAVIVALVALYAVVLDQGMLLSPVMGKLSATMNYVHELVHDGRHLLGAPCH